MRLTRLTLYVFSLFALVAVTLSVVAAPAAAAPSVSSAWPATHPAQRAIFCGIDGAEPSFQYAQRLTTEINRLTSRGASVAAAVDTLRERARCPAGSHLPVTESFLFGEEK